MKGGLNGYSSTNAGAGAGLANLLNIEPVLFARGALKTTWKAEWAATKLVAKELLANASIIGCAPPRLLFARLLALGLQLSTAEYHWV